MKHGQTSSLRSSIYKGAVHHERLQPKSHAFSYQMYMFYVDLDEIEAVCKLSSLCSMSAWSPLRFLRSDFHGDERESIKSEVYKTVKAQIGKTLSGPVMMLANWRCFGFNFNPLCTYYCFDARGEHLEAVVAEVTNTPWFERHAYVLDASTIDSNVNTDSDSIGDVSASFEKQFTVSPFNPVNMRYQWLSSKPMETLEVEIKTYLDQINTVNATMILNRIPLSRRTIWQTLIQFPCMSIKVVAAIYWQALKLYLKGVPFLGKNKTLTSE